MSYSVENINDCTKKLVFTFEDVNLESQIKDALVEKQKESNLKGFRKGKAPLSFVQQVYGAQVENDALYRFVSEEFYKAVQTEDFRAIGYPNFGNTKREKNNVSFDATIEIFPTVTIADYTKYEFTKDDEAVSDKDFDDLVGRYLAPKAEMVEITDDTRKIENGIHTVFNFEGEKEDGSKPADMKAEEFLLEIGSGQFIPGFEEKMIGLKKSDKKTIELTFPNDYHQEDLRDAKVKFHVEVLELKEKKLPELNDELAKEFGFETVDDFNTKTKLNLTTQKKREVQQKLHEDILKKLVEDNSFDIPATLVEQQKKSVREELGSNLKSQGFDENMTKTYFEKWNEDILQKAEFQVRSGLILDTLAKMFKVEANDDDMEVKFTEMAAQSGMDIEQLSTYYKSNEQVKNNLMYAIREEKTFDKLITEMKVK